MRSIRLQAVDTGELVEKVSVFFKSRGVRFVVTGSILVVLLSLAFVFLYPLLYMFITSTMGSEDLISPFVVWIPREFNFYNYYLAALGLRFGDAVVSSLILSVGSAVAHTAACAIAGYGLARYRFPGSGLIFGLTLFTIIVPPQTIMIPLFIQFHDYKWTDSYLPFIVPAALGHGLRGGLFVIILRQFFSSLPWELDDAARIDGLGGFRIFAKIMVPLSVSALLVVFLFSMVWHWNDFLLPSVFIKPEKATLSVRLQRLWTDIRQYMAIRNREGGMTSGTYDQYFSSAYYVAIMNRNESLGMAACMLVISIPLGIYFVLQRFFTESIERTGLVE